MTPRLLPSLLAGLALAVLSAGTVQAQAPAYPSKTIRLLVGSPPGAPSDITARLFAERLSQRLGQSVVVENRPGAGTSLAAGVVAAAEPDGYTLGVSPDTVVTVNPLVYPKLTFDARKDLMNLSVLANFTQMLVCHPGTGVKTAAELVARANSNRMIYASGGAGVPGHLAAEMFLREAGVGMEHIAYRGPAPATTAVLAGEVNCGFLATPTVLPHVKTGRLVALAVSSAEPSALAPQVPTLAEALHKPTLDISFKLLLQAPKGLPAAIASALEQAAGAIMTAPDVQTRLHALDLRGVGSTRQVAEAQVQADTARWAPVVKRLNLTLD
ncbi:tripartite tricarboxylate transporter substrate-binding protein [Hydrogenophaga sp. SNF1]|uniref:Bug family tripartite tricarboxylate transporter substrate binding protein n=1 Tax=Hydrogenophaga sp. SNF1 TaxID=3098762 RepID=UPI002ACBECFA|nr:tripartite tricarboxylate transporter substrate-binding protein [Hydrogenophaga sp. SNF1]WQB82861.1 tripartite tricarboxylate transporter substrate-binding protein [Hydrogenophaga sp. SNF1]